MQSMVGLGQGVRCSATENLVYSKSETNFIPLITWVPEGCQYKKETKTKTKENK